MITKTRSTPLELALQYAGLGWSVFPCHNINQDGQCTCGKKCDSPGKHPRTRNGLKDASIDPKQIQKWWKNWPNANIAILTGRESGLAVLDIDAKSGGLENLDLLEAKNEPLPSTLTVQTGGGGRHYYFSYPTSGFKNSTSKIATGIDTRGEGGYVLAPASNHKSGREYTWQDDEPGEIELALPPQWVLNQLNKNKKQQGKAGGNNGTSKVCEGGRNESLASVAGKLRHTGLDVDTIFAALAVENNRRCDPPLDEGEVKKIATSIGQYKPGTGKKNCPYKIEATGIVWFKPTRDGPPVEVSLTNFSAIIVAQVFRDDGAEPIHYFEMAVNLNGRSQHFTITASEFTSLNWVVRELGAMAIVYPGHNIKDQTRCAIQVLSKNIETKTIFTHIGWRKIDKKWLYLHSGGAIGTNGTICKVEVDMGQQKLNEYRFPDPPEGETLKDVISEILTLPDLTLDRIIIPLLSATFRAPLGEMNQLDLSLFFVGPTGSQKTEVTAIGQSFFGSRFNGKNLPGNWSSTANSLERQTFLVKDSLFIIDDFAPGGSKYDVDSLHKKADQLLRGQGNSSGRGRMRANGSLKPENYPRGLIISSGEDIPKGQSLRARTMIIEVARNDIDLNKLTMAQANAEMGIHAQGMAAYLKWLAEKVDSLKVYLALRREELRDCARKGFKFSHDRTPDNQASLALGWETFLNFAKDSNAISDSQYEELKTRGWNTLGEVAQAQGAHYIGEEPATRFMELLDATITSGHAHIASIEDEAKPDNPARWGWREHTTGSGEFLRNNWHPYGDRIGWVDDKENLFLDPHSSFAAVQKMAKDQGTSISISPQTLWKRLDEKGLLLSKDATRKRNTIRKTIMEKRREVLHIKLDGLYAHKSVPTVPTDPPPQKQQDLWDKNKGHKPGADEKVSHKSVPQD
jgi:hypothetical protein